MSAHIAALPMYDWPETCERTDEGWARLRDRLRGQGIDAPERLVRRNADMPAVTGGIRDVAGTVIAPDPATLPPDELDLPTLWRHPQLLLSGTCWGPMETGLADQAHVVGQSRYDGVEGGKGEDYSSAIVMRREGEVGPAVPAPGDGAPLIPVDRLEGRRFAFNGPDSMSGIIALRRNLVQSGAIDGEDGFPGFWSAMVETGGHRLSIRAVAEGRADIAAIDCRSWALAHRHEPAAGALAVVGWTGRRKGLPFIQARALPDALRDVVAEILAGENLLP